MAVRSLGQRPARLTHGPGVASPPQAESTLSLHQAKKTLSIQEVKEVREVRDDRPACSLIQLI